MINRKVLRSIIQSYCKKNKNKEQNNIPTDNKSRPERFALKKNGREEKGKAKYNVLFKN